MSSQCYFFLNFVIIKTRKITSYVPSRHLFDVGKTPPNAEDTISQHEAAKHVGKHIGQLHSAKVLNIDDQQADHQVKYTHSYMHGATEALVAIGPGSFFVICHKKSGCKNIYSNAKKSLLIAIAQAELAYNIDAKGLTFHR